MIMIIIAITAIAGATMKALTLLHFNYFIVVAAVIIIIIINAF